MYFQPPSVDLGCFAYPDPRKFPVVNHSGRWTTSNNLINLDPGFVKADPRGELDFSLRPDSPLIRGGFRPLPAASEYGPRGAVPQPPAVA